MWKQKYIRHNNTPAQAELPTLYFERMEPRILFSADALGGLVAGDPFSEFDAQHPGMNVNESASFLKDVYAGSSKDADETLVAPDKYEPTDVLVEAALVGLEQRQEIILIDAATPNYQQLLESMDPDKPGTDYQIFILQSDRDGIEQIGEILGRFEGVDAIHLISHGNSTGLQLGNAWLGEASLDDNADAISSWARALSADADLLIYGCNLAAGESGLRLIDNLADLTGADVAASDDLTGAATLGGDWQLEYTVGDIEGAVAISTTAMLMASLIKASFN